MAAVHKQPNSGMEEKMAVTFSPETRFQQKAIELLKHIEKDIEVVHCKDSYDLLKTDDLRICRHGWFSKTEYRRRRILATISLNSGRKYCSFQVFGQDFLAVAEKMAKEIDSILGEFEVVIHLSQKKRYEHCESCSPTYYY